MMNLFNVEMYTGTSRSYAVVIKLLSGYFDFFLLMFPKTLQNSAVVNGFVHNFFLKKFFELLDPPSPVSRKT